MSVKSMVTVGFLAMVAVTGVVNAPGSLAADTSRGEGMARIGHGGSTYQSKINEAGDCQMKADNIERIGHGGSTYASRQVDGTGACQIAEGGQREVDVIERIGAGGSTYSFRQSNVQTAGR